nr:protein translocase subunit SecD [Kineococcus xinjiangensis]
MLGLLLAILFGSLAAGVRWGEADWKPGLALDLQGGTQVILTPRATNGAEVTEENLQRAVAIISRRVNSTGVSEAQVQVQGGRNIVVAIPGTPSRETLNLIKQSAQLRFRPVILEVPTEAPIELPQEPGAEQPSLEQPAPGEPAPGEPAPGEPAPAEPAPGEPVPGEPVPAEPAPEPTPSPTQSGNGAVVPSALLAATPSPAPEAPVTEPTEGPTTEVPTTEAPAPEAPAPAPSPTGGPAQPTATPTPPPTDNSDLAWVTPEVQQILTDLDCSNPEPGFLDDRERVLVTCNQEGTAKYVLGPVELDGTAISSASSAQAQNEQGLATGGWEVRMNFTGEGGRTFEEITKRLSVLPPPQNQFGIVLDGLVITAPRLSGPIPGGLASIEGDFTQEETETLASQLRFGALPLSFEVESEEQVSATLGQDQLRNGLIAGLIGLALVVVYSLIQYRALGLVTVGSLLIAGLLTYGVIALLSWLQGYRLSLAGVVGLIVAIGITADSFIVFFERVRDEIRGGRGLTSAVEVAWHRARRTILISGAVNLLSAVVLFVLAVGNVQGFAFTLGVTTLIDVVVVFLFTHPIVALMARTKFFGGGHKLSGFDPVHLGSVVARHALRAGPPQETTIAARRAAARAQSSTDAGSDA